MWEFSLVVMGKWNRDMSKIAIRCYYFSGSKHSVSDVLTFRNRKILSSDYRSHFQPTCKFSSYSQFRHMYSQEKYKYVQAMKKLNELQSNAAVISQSILDADRPKTVLPSTVKFLNTAGIKVEELDKLNVIHVAGTKGKGSTGAFCENILRQHGLRTGFYSSPHIVAVRERIRIDGEPLSESRFVENFWQIYNLLDDSKENDKDMPSYFIFLTVMAFHVFLKEKVDAAVIEVGIGGQYDCTNIIQRPLVCGITSLGLDHVTLLGNTIDKIAWQKAGIFKKLVPAFTVPQKADAMSVLISRAAEIGCPLYLAPQLDFHDWKGKSIELGISGRVQYDNAALAIQLALTLLRKRENSNYLPSLSEMSRSDIPTGPLYAISDQVARALRSCVWPGRNEIINLGEITYYLDGAHTIESMQNCVEWFSASSFKCRTNVHRVLVFNSTGGRQIDKLLSVLTECHFDQTVFCPNTVSRGDQNPDQMNYMISYEQQLENCKSNRVIWDSLLSSRRNTEEFHSESREFCYVKDVILWLSSRFAEDPARYETGHKIHILVTGSLHLVGGFISLIKPGS